MSQTMLQVVAVVIMMGSDSDYKCYCCGEVLGTMHYDCWLTFKRTEFLVSKTHFEN